MTRNQNLEVESLFYLLKKKEKNYLFDVYLLIQNIMIFMTDQFKGFLIYFTYNMYDGLIVFM